MQRASCAILCTGFLVLAPVAGALGGEGPRLPTFVAMSLSAPTTSSPAYDFVRAAPIYSVPRTISRPDRSPRGRAAASSGTRDEDDDDDDLVPARPGTLSQDFAKVPDPTPFLKRTRPTLGPHLSPMREFDLTERTSLGVFGQADRLEARFGGVSTGSLKPASAAPSIRARDVGGGLTVQFKLGQ